MRRLQNILFINPPEPGLLDSKNDTGYSYFEPPLGLLYVYSHMKQKKTRNAVFLDLNTELKNQQRVDLQETLGAIISKNKPDVVALSALYYAAIPVFHEVVNIIKLLILIHLAFATCLKKKEKYIYVQPKFFRR